MEDAVGKLQEAPKKDSVTVLLEKYDQIRSLLLPHFSSCSSKDEDESNQDNSDSKAEEDQVETGLEFDLGKSDSEESINDKDEKDVQLGAENDLIFLGSRE